MARSPLFPYTTLFRSIGADFIAKSAPDGHTLVMLLTAHAINATLMPSLDRKSTRLNSSHLGISYGEIATLSLHDALPIYRRGLHRQVGARRPHPRDAADRARDQRHADAEFRSEEHTSELQSLRHLVWRDRHSFPTRRSSDL